MLRIVSSCLLTAVVTAGTFVPAIVTAHAQDLELRIGPDGVRPVIRDPREEERRRREMERERDAEEGFRRGCDPEEAQDLARDAGLRRPRVVRMNERRIVIEGMTRDGRERMTFANRPGCPEI